MCLRELVVKFIGTASDSYRNPGVRLLQIKGDFSTNRLNSLVSLIYIPRSDDLSWEQSYFFKNIDSYENQPPSAYCGHLESHDSGTNTSSISSLLAGVNMSHESPYTIKQGRYDRSNNKDFSLNFL